jgi:hypothetical protein
MIALAFVTRVSGQDIGVSKKKIGKQYILVDEVTNFHLYKLLEDKSFRCEPESITARMKTVVQLSGISDDGSIIFVTVIVARHKKRVESIINAHVYCIDKETFNSKLKEAKENVFGTYQVR